MTNEITIRELQDSINRRLEQFGGRKYNSRNSASPEYHGWYFGEITAELKERGISIFSPTTWRIVADIDDAAPLKVSYEDVAEVVVDIKADRRYSYGGPGTVRSIRVKFRENLLGLTISAARARLLEEDKASQIEYYRGEREKAIAAEEEAEKRLAELETVVIKGAGE